MEHTTEIAKELPAGVEVYIGAPVRYASEQHLLAAVVSVSSQHGRAVVLANVLLGDRQVDLAVATERGLTVFEAKGVSQAIHGAENGPWKLKTTGGWREVRNPYQQALEAKFALKDATPELWNAGAYPRAAVVFVPRLPEGSEIPKGDFKVAMVELSGLEQVFPARSSPIRGQALERVRRVAEELGCTPVSSVAEACDPDLKRRGRLIAGYREEFDRTYGKEGILVPFECRNVAGETSTSIEVHHRVVDGKQDLLLRGGSGRGKTMLARACAVEFTRRGGVALFIAVKDYEGKHLNRVMDTEVALLGARSKAQVLLDTCVRLSLPLLVVVDGYNECVISHRRGLTRRVAALARRYSARILVTSQSELEGSDLLAIEVVEALPTSIETKTEIARSVLGGDPIPAEVTRLLPVVGSGLEARIVAEASLGVREDAGRYRLFDAFARRRLGDAAGVAIQAGSKIAQWLTERVAFSMSVRDCDRILESASNWDQSLRVLERGGLLATRGDRVSFAHERYLDAFAAEAAVRTCRGSAQRLLALLRSPVNAQRKDLIVGAIDDDTLLSNVLDGLDDAETILNCLAAVFGARAREWAESRCAEVLEKVGDEAQSVRIGALGEGYYDIQFRASSLAAWSGPEMAFLLTVLPKLVFRGEFIERMFDIVGAMDRRLREERRRLVAERAAADGALRDRLFARTYVMVDPRSSPGLSLIWRGIQGSSGAFREHASGVSEKLRRVMAMSGADQEWGAGQLYLVLHLCRSREEPYEGFVARTIRERWEEAPYHLRLQLLEAAELGGPRNDEGRRELRDALERLPNLGLLLNSSLMDALASVGGLEQEEEAHEAVARAEVTDCLGGVDVFPTEAAWRLYTCQFDHPFATAYWKVIRELPTDDQKKLMVLASRAAEPGTFGVSTLVVGLWSWGDAGLCESIERFAIPPSEDVLGPDDAVSAFVVAHAALARLRCELPQRHEVPGTAMAALGACGRLIYWMNRVDVDVSGREAACAGPLDVLVSGCRYLALDAVRMCQSASHMSDVEPGTPPIVWGIADGFGKDLVDVCRRALVEPVKQRGCFRHFHEHARRSCLSLALDLLGRHGNSTDAGLLRTYAEDSELGRSAIAALKTMEEQGALAHGRADA